MTLELEETKYILTDAGQAALKWAREAALGLWEDGEKCDLHDFDDRVAILLEARLAGALFGKEFNDFSTRAMDNYAIEQAFLQGFLETRVKTKTGEHWVPKEGS